MLVLDDLALRPLSAEQAADLLEVIEDRHGRRSTIVTSQLPVRHWHEVLGEPTIADAILDRLIHTAYRIELRGDSYRGPTRLSPATAPEAHDRPGRGVAGIRSRSATLPRNEPHPSHLAATGPSADHGPGSACKTTEQLEKEVIVRG